MIENIKNIVFYKQNNKKIATIFYHDGSSKTVPYAEGIEIAGILARIKGIRSKKALKELINQEIIHVVTEEEYIRNYNYYCGLVSKPAETISELERFEAEAGRKEIIIDVPEESMFRDEEEIYIGNRTNEECIDPLEEEQVSRLIREETGYDYERERRERANYKTSNKEKKTKNKKGIIKRVAAVVLALAIGAGLYSCASRKSKEGNMLNSNLVTMTAANNTPNSGNKGTTNAEYSNYSYSELLEVTTNEHQRDSMNFLDATLTNFNAKFANAYLEEGKDVKAALSFDEIVSLQQAYSDFTPEQIKAYFNGTIVDSSKMARDYKNATLQLMGAHVIETRQNPVDMSWLIDSKEGRDFYFKYHNLFLDAKEATGTDKLMKINDFFNVVRTDFPITKEIRTEGISHADAYQEIESYKLSVTPMIAAAEMMFQNLESDLTLDNSEIDFLNDLGLCDYATKKFEKIVMLTMDGKEDMTNPTYEQYREAIIKELKERNNYVVSDAKRDLSRLSAFQNAVNWHFEMVEGEFTGSISYGTVTTYETVEESMSKPIPADEKAKIDAEIAQENANSRRTGERDAQNRQQQRQAEEDENARRIAQEVENDNANLQDQINNANNKINNNEKVNESDFNGNVTFYDDYKDSNGNLSDSVQNITTDPSGDKTNDPLPDPNAMGANFDAGKPFSMNSNQDNYEQLVDEYINSLAEEEFEGAYEYHK
ncbi:MAG: hypothetical protein IJI22_02905 [Bacilli bacterium]|nr:hypothetical protein [Bacilli bacterium]